MTPLNTDTGSITTLIRLWAAFGPAQLDPKVKNPPHIEDRALKGLQHHEASENRWTIEKAEVRLVRSQTWT